MGADRALSPLFLGLLPYSQCTSMLSLPDIELRLVQAIKARDKLAMEVWRGLKARVHNQAKVLGQVLDENRILALARSEVKRRHEAATSFTAGGRPELAEKEMAEARLLEAYLPQAPDVSEIAAKAQAIIAEQQFTAKDFGKAMAALKQAFRSADGAALAKVLKEKLSDRV